MNSGLARIEPRGQGSICIWIGPNLVTTFPVSEREYAEALVSRLNDYARRNLPPSIRRRVSHVDIQILALIERNTEIANRLQTIEGLDEIVPDDHDALIEELKRLHVELRDNCAGIANFSSEWEAIQFCVDAYSGNQSETNQDVRES